MPTIGAAFIDLDRVARALDGIGRESTHVLTGGKYTNVSRYLSSERWTVSHVLDAVRSSPEAFTGAVDRAAAEAHLEHALAQIDAAAAATKGATKVGLLGRGRDLSAAAPLLRFAPTDQLDAAAGALDVAGTAGGDVAADAAAAAGTAAGAVPTGTSASSSAADDVRRAHALLGGTRDLPELEQLPAGAPLEVPAGLAVTPADDPAVRATGHRAVQATLRGAFHAGISRLMGHHAVNGAHLPETGPVLVAPTHGAFRDPVHTMAQLHRPLRPMINQKFMDIPVLGTALRLAGGYGVRHGNAAEGLADARGVLVDGQAGLLYPEAMLIRGDWVGSERNGLAELALQTHASIQPAATYGSRPHALRDEGWGRPLVSVAFGDLVDPGRAAYTDANVELLREQVARAHDTLLPQARADYEARRAVSNAHRPWFYGGAAAAGIGAGALALHAHHDA